MMMNQDKRKTVMLYPATSKDLTLEIGVVCAGVLLPLIIGLDTVSDISGDGVGTALRLAMVLLFFGGAALVGFLYWRMFTARDFLRLDTERGVLLHGRWRWGWQAQREYPLSMFAAVAAEKVQNDYRGYYGRLWLESADGRNDLVLEENLLPHKGSLHELDRIQNHIAKATGLAKRPVINTVIRAAEETAANPAQLQPLQAKTLPAWRQAVNLAAAGLVAAFGGGLAQRQPAEAAVFRRGAAGARAVGGGGIGCTRGVSCTARPENAANTNGLAAALRNQSRTGSGQAGGT